MAQVVYSENALANLERVFEFLAEDEPVVAASAAGVIRHTVALLVAHPLIGRRLCGELRELAFAYGKTGYVALYRCLPDRNLVRVLVIRHQRELD